MEEKNYTGWMPVKAKLHNDSKFPHGYREGAVYWMAIGENIEYEEDGKGRQYTRPVLVVKGFSPRMLWGVPLSTQLKEGKYYCNVKLEGETRNALLSQLRMFDTARMGSRIGKINDSELATVKKLLREFLS